MTVTAIPGPAINYGISLTSSGAAAEYNEERGPSLNDLGEGTLDPRPQFGYKPGNRPGVPVYGWPGCFGGPCVDFIPVALDSSGIAAVFSAAAASGTVTLQTSATSSAFRTISGFIPSTVPVSNPSSITVLMIDGFQAGFAVGQGSSSVMLGAGCGFGGPIQAFGVTGASTNTATINIWNPLIMAGRLLAITNSSVSSSNTTFVFTGFDVYGMRMTATVVGPSSATGATPSASTLKAFKYLQSITWSGSSGGGTALQIGTIDTFGFPLYVDHPSYVTVWIGPSSGATVAIGASTTHTFGLGSSIYGAVGLQQVGGSSLASTTTTGDVRGTYASSLATTGNTAASGSTGMRITMNISPKVVGLATVTQNSFWGLVGLPQA